MDKQTLSNYGWLVIVTLILAVMLALATPFGTYVGDAVVSIANGYVGASNNAMEEDSIQSNENKWDDKLNGTLKYASFKQKVWQGLQYPLGIRIWTDGTNLYHSDNSTHYVLKNGKWESTTFVNTPSNFNTSYIWTDGTNTYYGNNSQQYVLNGNTWVEKAITGIDSGYFWGSNVWNNGKNTYYSYGTRQYVLEDGKWVAKTWKGLTNFTATYVWNDTSGNTYYSTEGNNYILDGDTWKTKTWTGLTNFMGQQVWNDGKNVYYSYQENHYILEGSNWVVKKWEGLKDFHGANIWTDGNKTYFSYSSMGQYEFTHE